MKKCNTCGVPKSLSKFYKSHSNSETRRGECIKCTSSKRIGYDWKNVRTGWLYKKDAPEDSKWLKDRDALFKENGNGWWIFKGTPQYAKYLKTTKDRLNENRKNSKK